jgi:hypothetical protein
MNPSDESFQPKPGRGSPAPGDEEGGITGSPQPEMDFGPASPVEDRFSELVYSGPTDEELEAFVGPKANYYLHQWSELRHGGGSTGFNWAGFLIAGIWLPFRKLYAIALIFYAILFAESILEEVITQFALRQEPPRPFTLLVGIVAAAIVGALGNRWYWNHARRVVLQVRALELPHEEHLDELRRRGGTSLLAGLGLAGGYFALTILGTTVMAFMAELL